MEITQLDGLENFGNSEIVSDISDFLSLEELGHNIDEVSTDDINLTEVELNSKKIDKDKDVSNPIIPLEGGGEGQGRGRKDRPQDMDRALRVPGQWLHHRGNGQAADAGQWRVATPAP